jgi:hypothetical protein
VHVEAGAGEIGGQTEHAAETVVAAVEFVIPVHHPQKPGPVILSVKLVAQFLQVLLPDVVRFTVRLTLSTDVVPSKTNVLLILNYLMISTINFCFSKLTCCMRHVSVQHYKSYTPSYIYKK